MNDILAFKNELLRKIVHIISLIFPLIYTFTSFYVFLYFMIFSLFVLFSIEFGRKYIRNVATLFQSIFGLIVRPHEIYSTI